GLDCLATLTITHIRLKHDTELHQVPTPRKQSQALLDAPGVTMPTYITTGELRAATKTKLPKSRKTH
ncbi:MAG: hypothetical protein ACLFV4_10275, partial [Candidatus Hydrogenedentota bacterium]